MNQMYDKIKKIRLAANVGLWGSLLLIALTIAEHYLAEYVWIHEIVTNDYTRHLFTIIGLVLAVTDIAVILFTLRRQLPRLRQMDSVEERLDNYLTLVCSVYLVTLVVVLILCAIIVIIRDNTLIMLLLLLFVTLVLNFPNMYKIKSDLGFDDGVMKQLFGDQYVK